KFLQATERYHDLKTRLNDGEITVNDLKQALKKLMIVDEEGRYWMIGGKSGRWYRHDGTQWIQDDPPRAVEGHDKWQTGHEDGVYDNGDIPPRTSASELVGNDRQSHETEQEPQDFERKPGLNEAGFNHHNQTRETDLPIVTFPATPATVSRQQTQAFSPHEPTQPLSPPGTQSNTANCRVCDAAIPAEAEYCPVCGANQNETVPATRAISGRDSLSRGANTLQIRSIHPFSLLFLLGGLGLILGVIIGAAFGIFQIFGDLIYQFPRMLQETRGKIQGGLIFGVLGGTVGFLSFALAALVASGLYNLLADLFGGLRIRIRS
ncbi:MAG: hypothetical protein JXA62_08360, partial [Candidatus Aminicenantes bacterium]|nr:hypothetical protein [Candidatus Aminicenantes bacterium]